MAASGYEETRPDDRLPREDFPSAAESSRNVALPWIVLGSATLVWIVFYALAAPAFGGIDLFLFRDPGCAVAAGEGLVSRSVPHGAEHVTPELLGAYTPATPLLFGVAAKLFGCNPYANTFYNLFFALLVSVSALIALFRAFRQPGPRIFLAAVFGVLLPSGVFFDDYDRPEIPAFCLSVALLLVWQRARSVFAKSLLLGSSGIVFLFHPWAGISIFLLLGFLLVFEDSLTSYLARFRIAVSGGFICILAIAACALYFHHLDPTVLHRFLSHAVGNNTGVGVVLDTGVGAANPSKLHGFVHAFHRTFDAHMNVLSGSLNLAGLCVVIALFAYTKRRFAIGDGRLAVWMQFASLAAITFFLPAVLFFAQQNYFALGNGLLILILASGNFALARRARQSTALVTLLAIVILSTFPPLAVSVLESIETRNSFQLANERAARTQQEFKERGLADANILVDHFQYFIYKPYLTNLYDLEYLEPNKSTAAYKGLLLCYAAQFAFSRSQVSWPVALHQADWQLVDSGEDPVRITLLGKPIMRRNWSWGCDAYVRK